MFANDDDLVVVEGRKIKRFVDAGIATEQFKTLHQASLIREYLAAQRVVILRALTFVGVVFDHRRLIRTTEIPVASIPLGKNAGHRRCPQLGTASC